MARELSVLATALGIASPVWNSIKLAKEIVDFAGEIPEWMNYNENLEELIHNLKNKLDCLEAVEADVQIELANTEVPSGKKRKREVEHWLQCVREVADEVRNLENKFNWVSSISRFLFRAWVGKCVTEKIKLLIELQDRGQFPQGLLLDVHQDGRQPFPTNELVGQGLIEKRDLLLSRLIDPRAVTIGVLGPKGIGKTTLLIQLFNKLCDCYHHYHVYYVKVPQDFTILDLQEAILKEMKVKLEGSEHDRARRISNVLRSKKQFVMILDGVSREFDPIEVGIPNKGSGEKLVLASQSRDVCNRMLCLETILLERLSTEDSESLFMEKLVPNVPLSDDIKDVAGEIVAKCEGIPSRIIHMARLLRGNFNIYDWRTTLNEM